MVFFVLLGPQVVDKFTRSRESVVIRLSHLWRMNTLTTVSRFLIGLVLCHMHVFCQAQINAYSIDQTVTLASNSFSIDVNGDSSEDYTFEIYPLTEMTTAARVISLGGSSVMDNSTFGYPDALGCGDGVSEPYSEEMPFSERMLAEVAFLLGKACYRTPSNAEKSTRMDFGSFRRQ